MTDEPISKKEIEAKVNHDQLGIRHEELPAGTKTIINNMEKGPFKEQVSEAHRFEYNKAEAQKKLCLINEKNGRINAIKEKANNTIAELENEIPVFLRQEIARTKLETEKSTKAFQKDQDELILEVKQLVLEIGETVQTEDKKATATFKHTPGKWNTDMLAGMAISMPGIMKAYTEGKPSVSFTLKD